MIVLRTLALLVVCFLSWQTVPVKAFLPMSGTTPFGLIHSSKENARQLPTTSIAPPMVESSITYTVPTWKGSQTSLRHQATNLPLIPSSDTWGNAAVLTFSSTLAQTLAKKTMAGRLLGPPVTAMALSFAFASLGLINPGGTAAAKTLQSVSLNLATPLILLGVNLSNCAARCGPLLPSFLAAASATLISCTVGWMVAGPSLTAALGRDGLTIAAALLSKNIGGGINYIAVCRCLGASPNAIAAGLCADNIFALIYFPASSALSAGRPDLAMDTTPDGANGGNCTAVVSEEASLSKGSSTQVIHQLCTLFFLSSALLWAGEKIGGHTGALPACTLLTILFASLAPSKWIQSLQGPAEILGTSLLYLFFSTIGAPGLAVAESVRTSLLPIATFLTCLYSIHFGILWTLHKFFGHLPPFRAQRLLVASSAAIGGPATSVALAQANQWKSLVLPGLLVGNIGFSVATFVALLFAKVLRPMP